MLEWLGYAMTDTVSGMLIKLPATIIDVCVTGTLFAVTRRIQSKQWLPYVIALLYWCNPAVLYNTALWGQTDSIYTYAVLLATLLLAYKRYVYCGAVLACALLIKIQAVIFVPFFFLVVLTRPKQLLAVLLGFMVPWLLISVPFIAHGSMASLLGVYTGAADHYPTLAFSAYNAWWILFADATGSTSDLDLLFGVITYRTAGIILFAIVYTYVVMQIGRLWYRKQYTEQQPQVAYGLLTTLAYGFFVLCTQMHERYMFPVLTFGAVWLAYTPSWALFWLYIWASLLHYCNLAGVLPYDPVTIALFRQFPLFDAAIAMGHVVVFYSLLKLSFRSVCSNNC